MPEDKVGELFDKELNYWIHNEPMWFWRYLTDGQQIVWSGPESGLSDHFKVEGMPAEPMWKDISIMVREMGLSGEAGGGIFECVTDLDDGCLGNLETPQHWEEDDDGYVRTAEYFSKPRWMMLFEDYETFTEPVEYSLEFIEIRPAWFHLANHIFFNASIRRLPIFCAVFSPNKQIEKLQFLHVDLSLDNAILKEAARGNS
jgi:hypothetical protein